MLEPYAIHSRLRRIGVVRSAPIRAYFRADLGDAWRRYLPEEAPPLDEDLAERATDDTGTIFGDMA